jgi:hypothetical protein
MWSLTSFTQTTPMTTVVTFFGIVPSILNLETSIRDGTIRAFVLLGGARALVADGHDNHLLPMKNTNGGGLSSPSRMLLGEQRSCQLLCDDPQV